MKQDIIITNDATKALNDFFNANSYDKIFTLTDTNTAEHCLGALAQCPWVDNDLVITIESSDTHKTLASMEHVWKSLGDKGGTRHSCLINLGGGMVTDLGGFAASTFKRGIDFVNIPTTLLAMVDASVGGKTGINFNGLKNEIGVFNEARAVIVDTVFLKTLDEENLVSGYAEMLKHSLISTTEMWSRHVSFNLAEPDYTELLSMIEESIHVKENIVEADPHEQGLRKALNLGHTVGHAFESLAMSSGRPVLHGYAVAYGMVCELYLSAVMQGFPTDKMRQTVRYIRENYGQMPISCDNYEALYALMQHDKKNTSGRINFTLLKDVGQLALNQTASKEQIFEALDFYREG